MFKLFKALSVAAIVFAALFAGTIAYVYWFSAHTSAVSENPDDAERCAVVFGAAVWPGGRPSDALADRVYAATTLYEEGLADCLIFSGASSAYGAHEVDVMRDVALEVGVPATVMYFDYQGTNTLTTLSHLDVTTPYILVSNDFHLARISLLVHKLGLEHAVLYAAPYQNGRYISETSFVIREAVALWYYALIPNALSNTLRSGSVSALFSAS